jgi:hypothetical protein
VILNRTPRTGIDAYDGQTLGFPLRDATSQVSGRLTERHALARSSKGAAAGGAREDDLTWPVGWQL